MDAAEAGPVFYAGATNICAVASAASACAASSQAAGLLAGMMRALSVGTSWAHEGLCEADQTVADAIEGLK
ncbi:hypothetical protein OZX67_00475 [Bifidobacterium sp. ESL0728]|uniref:hypothetical protein n=1 Tax=Bifidobacterium sp. ESL0728 TaxID=2983220 RepID=UPI0023F8D08E|nr:hypothetical protein [Bifidobacterium sp. ESL0728]WEV59094.1 hypothetical protein OZX67_00475 [Bifidobacterium sp. ESL0728]